MMDGDVAVVAKDLQRLAEVSDCRMLLLGAHARDIWLEPGAEQRRTTDVDFAIWLEAWPVLDQFLLQCEERFDNVNKHDLSMLHRGTGLRVDLVPCGGVQSVSGAVSLRGSARVLHLSGIQRCFSLATPLLPGLARVLAPPPEGVLVLKVFAYFDRRAPRDLRDLGVLLRRFPFAEDAVWEDAVLLDRFSAGVLTLDDASPWFAGRRVADGFSYETVDALVAKVGQLRASDHARLGWLVSRTSSPDAAHDQAERLVMVFLEGLCAPKS